MNIGMDEAIAWLNDYKAAWEKRDVAAALALFGPGAEYKERRFGEPLLGHATLESYWRDRVFEHQRDITFDFELWGVRDNELLARWRADFTWLPNSSRRSLDGVMHVVFGDRQDGRLLGTSFNEWFDEIEDQDVATTLHAARQSEFTLTRTEAETWLAQVERDMASDAAEVLMKQFAPDVSFRFTALGPEHGGRQTLQDLATDQIFAHMQDPEITFDVWDVRDNALMAFWRSSYFWTPSNELVELDGVVNIEFSGYENGKLLASRFIRWFDQDRS